MRNWFAKWFFRKKEKKTENLSKKKIVLIPEDPSDYTFSIDELDENLKNQGVDINVNSVDDIIELKRANHLIDSRTTILRIIVVPMSIVPIWLMIILTLSMFGKIEMSEKMKFAFLGAITGDFLGLCYIVTRDLFPQGDSARRENKSGDNGEEDKPS